MKNKKIFKVFFREKPAMMLVCLLKSSQEHYASSLAKEVDCTYSHVVKVLNKMNNADLLSFNKQGRVKIIKLTKKGREVAKNIEGIRKTL